MARSDLFLRACRRESVEATPIWILRQAGRYLPEYRALREKTDFLTACRTPEIACEITLQPVRRLGVDAAILFSDILIPLPGMGVPVGFDPAPRIERPIRTRADIEALRVPDPREATPFVMDAVRLVRGELKGRVPLIGFAGAPFTLATYLVEGGASRSFSVIKKLLFAEPDLAHLLLSKCAATVASYLSEQVRAGAQAAMLFDTWCGVLSPADYETFALPYARRVFDALSAAARQGIARPSDTPAARQGAPVPSETPAASEGVAGLSNPAQESAPRIYYAGEAAGLLESVSTVGAEVIGIDWRIAIDRARRRLGGGVAVQGNLDPAVLLGPPALIRERAAEILRAADGAGHIFNLGHGILPDTPPENAQLLVETVHRLSSARPA